MISFVKKYKAFPIGFLITFILAWVLKVNGTILVDPNEHLTNILGFSFYWMLISIFIHKIPFLKEHIDVVKKIIFLIILLVIILVVDVRGNMPDNPITILLFVVFYIGMAYVLAPNFVGKYKVPIFIYYVLVYGIFLYLRLYSESYEVYRQNGKEIFLLFVLPIPVLFILWVYSQWKWFQSLKSEKTKAELSMLQAQINPHFFFNTLNNLYALTIKNSDKAPGVILKLSDMMRYTIYEGKKNVVSIQDEIEYLKNYIDLHKIRYKKKVDFSFSHQVENDAQITPLLFIILLENAFKHGVESLSENAYVRIDLRQKENYCYFEIENNFDTLESISEPGIGLENLKRRLELTFQKDYELTTNIEDNNIYKVKLKIPIHA